MWFFPVNRLLIYFSFLLVLIFFFCLEQWITVVMIAPSFCLWNLNGKLKVLPLHSILAFDVIEYNNCSTLLFIRNRFWILCHFFSAFIEMFIWFFSCNLLILQIILIDSLAFNNTVDDITFQHVKTL